MTLQALNAKVQNSFHYHRNSHCFGKDFEAASGQQENYHGPLAMPSVGTRRARESTFKAFTIALYYYSVSIIIKRQYAI